jgi:hypothetical protein
MAPMAALKIVQRGDLPLRDLIGAYAGETSRTMRRGQTTSGHFAFAIFSSRRASGAQ